MALVKQEAPTSLSVLLGLSSRESGLGLLQGTHELTSVDVELDDGVIGVGHKGVVA